MNFDSDLLHDQGTGSLKMQFKIKIKAAIVFQVGKQKRYINLIMVLVNTDHD